MVHKADCWRHMFPLFVFLWNDKDNYELYKLLLVLRRDRCYNLRALDDTITQNERPLLAL